MHLQQQRAARAHGLADAARVVAADEAAAEWRDGRELADAALAGEAWTGVLRVAGLDGIDVLGPDGRDDQMMHDLARARRGASPVICVSVSRGQSSRKQRVSSMPCSGCGV